MRNGTPTGFDEEGFCRACGEVIEAHEKKYRCPQWPTREQRAYLVGLGVGLLASLLLFLAFR